MAERRRLRPPTSGSFKPGNKAAAGRGGLTHERRLTNRFFAESVFREMTGLDEKTQRTRFETLTRCAYTEATKEGNGALAVKLLFEVMSRFLGQPTLPIAWADMTPERRERNNDTPAMKTIEIRPGMSAAEAARAYHDLLKQDDRHGR